MEIDSFWFLLRLMTHLKDNILVEFHGLVILYGFIKSIKVATINLHVGVLQRYQTLLLVQYL